jgi:hypothetical protein
MSQTRETRLSYWPLALLGGATLLFGAIHTHTTFEDFPIPSLYHGRYLIRAVPVTLWPIYAAAISLAAFQILWVCHACRRPWHKPSLFDHFCWSAVATVLFLPFLANIFKLISLPDRLKAIDFLNESISLAHILLVPVLLTPLLARRRADVALLIQMFFFAAVLFPCLAQLLVTIRTLIQGNGLPGWEGPTLDLFLAYTLLTSIPFLTTCFAISHLINKNRFLIPEATPSSAPA